MKNINQTLSLSAIVALLALPALCPAAINVEAELDGVALQAEAVAFQIRDLRGPLGIVMVKPGVDGTFRFSLELPSGQPYCIKAVGFTSDAIMASDEDMTCRMRLMPGDVNGDNAVDAIDLAMLSDCYGSESGDSAYREAADFNGDGAIDIADYALLSEHFGMRGSVPAYFVKLPVPGDINGDGAVNFTDLRLLAKAWGTSWKDRRYNEAADLNHDGWIDIADYAIFSMHFAPRGKAPAAVPFPYSGDINGDGVVGTADFKILETSYGASSKDGNYDSSADLNQDGWIDIADYAILSAAWGAVYPA